MIKRLAIIGSSDLGQLIAYHAEANCGFKVMGYYDDFNKGVINTDGPSILGTTDDILRDFENKKFDALIVAVGYKFMEFRKSIFEKFISKVPFASVIHPSCNIDRSCSIGSGCFILPGCILDRNVKINDNVLLNTGCVIAHDSEVGSHSFLSPAVKVAGFSKIGESCMVGINSTIIDNVILSNGIIIGAGALVTKSLKEKGIYIGCPAKLKASN